MIQMLRKESVSGAIQDLGHIRTQYMLADCLTKSSVKPDVLIQAVDRGILPDCDASPSFRSLLKHKAYAIAWLTTVDWKKENPLHSITTFLGEPVYHEIQAFLASPTSHHISMLASLEHASAAFHSMTLEEDDPCSQGYEHLPWHEHICQQCNRSYTHTHGLHDAGDCHSQNPHECCYADCDWFFGHSDSTAHNPYHSRKTH